MDSNDIGDDELISLSRAAKLFFRGELTKSSLRTEARKGNLEIIRIANKDFVTRNGIRRMIEKCRLPAPNVGKIEAPAPLKGMTAQEALRLKLTAQLRGTPAKRPSKT